MTTDSYHPDPLAQALATDPMLAVRGNLKAAVKAEEIAQDAASCLSLDELRHRVRGAAFQEALDMVQTHIEAAQTVAIAKHSDDSGLIPLIFGICLGAVSMLVVVGVIRWVL